MAISDTISDMLTRIRNAHMAGHTRVEVPHSKIKENILDVMQKEGYIRGFRKVDVAKSIHKIDVDLKFFEGKPAIKWLKRISTPGRRVYTSVDEIPQVNNGLGVAILSTSKGVLSDRDARQHNVGGEIICTIF